MKKVLSLILTAAMIAALILTSGSLALLKGDVNGDNEVDNKDVVILFRYVSGSNKVDDESVYDYNGDGNVDNKDVVSLFRFVSGGVHEHKHTWSMWETVIEPTENTPGEEQRFCKTCEERDTKIIPALNSAWVAHGQYYLSNGILNDWNGKSINMYEASTLKPISLNEVRDVSDDLYSALSDKKISYIYTIDLVFGTYDAGWRNRCVKNGMICETNGSYCFKIAQCSLINSYGEKYYSEDLWIPDPRTANAESLTKDTLFIPSWQEENDENGFSWQNNPVVIGGAGLYTLVIAQYTNDSYEGHPGFGIGVVLKEAKEGFSYDEIEPAKCTEHIYGEWEIISEPSCTRPGEKRRTCTVCGKSETEYTSELGHDYGPWKTTKAPTCTEYGEEQIVCRVCSFPYRQSIPPLGHDYGEDGVCKRCGQDKSNGLFDVYRWDFDDASDFGWVSSNKTDLVAEENGILSLYITGKDPNITTKKINATIDCNNVEYIIMRVKNKTNIYNGRLFISTTESPGPNVIYSYEIEYEYSDEYDVWETIIIDTSMINGWKGFLRGFRFDYADRMTGLDDEEGKFFIDYIALQTTDESKVGVETEENIDPRIGKKVIYKWDLTKLTTENMYLSSQSNEIEPSNQQWKFSKSIDNAFIENGHLVLMIDGQDPFMVSPMMDTSFDCDNISAVVIKICNKTDMNLGQFFFTSDGLSYHEAASVRYTFEHKGADNDIWEEIVINPKESPMWTGQLETIRIDPSEAWEGIILIDYCELYG